MQRTIRWMAMGAAVVVLSACSHHQSANAPLAFVPANTPYVIANLKPLTNDIRASMEPQAMARVSLSMNATRLRHMASRFTQDGKPQLAHLFGTLADTLNGKTPDQVAADMGIDPNGLFALYGLGLSPVMRGQLADPAKFDAYVAKLAAAYGQPFPKATLDGRNYQRATLGQSGLELVVAHHDKRFVLAIVPAKTTPDQMKLVLGLSHPEHSLASGERLAKLAKSEGYEPYAIGYLDTTKLPALLAGSHDPLIQALLTSVGGKAKAELAQKLPASCQGDLARIAARVPMLSFGYTALSAKTATQQLDVHLAPDIVKAFADIGTHVPGLGSSSTWPLDLALATPVKALREFGLGQAEAVAAHPFTCPALKGLNQSFAKLQLQLPKTAMPPFGQLNGIRVVFEKLDPTWLHLAHASTAPNQPKPQLDARLLIASSNPQGLLAMAQAFVPGLAQLKVSNDGKAVALPSTLTSRLGQNGQAWIALGTQAVALGIGPKMQAALPVMLSATAPPAGTLYRLHASGQAYASWMRSVGASMQGLEAKLPANATSSAEAKTQLADARQELDTVAKAFDNLSSVESKARFTQGGLRFTTTSVWK